MTAYRMNSTVGGVGDLGEVVEADASLWAGIIEAGYMSPLDEGDVTPPAATLPDESPILGDNPDADNT